MFDSAEHVYERLLRSAGKCASVRDDRGWAFGKWAVPVLERTSRGPEALERDAHKAHAVRVGQLSVSGAADFSRTLLDFADRLLSPLQPLSPSATFRDQFRRQWYSGRCAEGPLPQILLQELGRAPDRMVLIYDVTLWKLVSTSAVNAAKSRTKLQGEPLPLSRLPRRIALKLPPFSDRLTLDLKRLLFTAPEVGCSSQDGQFRIFQRMRGMRGDIDYSEESVAGIAIPGNGVGELNSLMRSFRRDPTGSTRGALDSRILIFAFLPRIRERNPNIKTVRFILDPHTGELHSIANVRQTFFGFCKQTAGLRLGIGSLLMGVQL